MVIKVETVLLPLHSTTQGFDVTIRNGTLVAQHTQNENEGPRSLLIPSLCHPHIHLDKAYLLTCNQKHDPETGADLPSYNDLIPSSGSFSEALTNTAKAKSCYTLDDLLLRGSQLLVTAAQQGVTHVRAFVEIDHVTELVCLRAAAILRHQFGDLVHIQICAFAQDPILSTEHGDSNRELMLKAFAGDRLSSYIDVLGTTPYVETSFEKGLENIDWAIRMAIQKKVHLDFHLDYNVDEGKKSMVWDVFRLLKHYEWTSQNPGKTVMLGHCTRMTLFSVEEMQRLAAEIREAQLPISFCGLPTSDIFMMGRPESGWGGSRQRGTLQVLEMIKNFDLNACISVNNIGNAFTPWGTGDPLALASLGVGLYQAGTEEDAKLLLESISTRARKAIGVEDIVDDIPRYLLIKNQPSIECAGMSVPARQRVSIKDVVWDPPEVQLREVLREKK